ncbi:LruC domain-containing protein [Croceimicrobium hydrocarbonivorans]|uniref:LruC domain-containing protein n=1 Tax=Croceimicrobium hydrocarbonivorans TaxID=2761580 RepID=A0A7H0VAP2_9FLAO|nr:LruC domain-containing protein [Croceimicrobium hydrocarbonivorans]QNR22790.1 LruC domain-containing protein [Croceimicrobium hydrocarbonivorans]
MMKLVAKTSILIATALFFTACEKDNNTDSGPTAVNQSSSTLDLKIPAGFNFETTESVNLDLNIDQAPLNARYLLKVYTENPSVVASPIYQAFISNGASLNTAVTIPSGLQQLYLVMQAPDGSSFLTIVPKAKNIAHTFYRSKNKAQVESFGSPDCVSGCDHSLTHNNWWEANIEDDVYCVTGSYNGNGGITVKNGAILRLCGSGSIPNLTLNKGQIQIVAGANVTVNNFNINSNSDNELVVYQGATLTITNWFSPNADVVNYGTMNVAALNLNSEANLENHGDFTVTTTNYCSFNGDVDNYGTLIVSGNASINSGSKFENYCGLYFNGDLQHNGEIKCFSYTKVGGKWTINGGAKHEMKDGAMAVCEDLMLNGKIEGKGSTSLFKVNDRSDANSGAEIKKNLQFCDMNGIENIASSIFKDGAVEGCSLVIPSGSCNPEGNGQPQIADADNDGVADELDAYPNDASRAANSYFPSENSYGTVAYEDLWPAFGDYDFNDLVVDYRYQQVLNANNEVVDLKARFVSRAMGGSLDNGFGIALDVAPSAISSVSGTRYFNNVVSTNANGTESGQSNAVIIVYDDASQVLVNTTGQAFVNTVSGNPTVAPDTTDITINFSSAQTAASLGTAPYNPFIFVDQTRGREVHLAGEAPTDLADASLFGTLDDDTDPNSADDTYKSANNLPWAIHVVGGFNYPEERVDISQAYNYFSVWAQSGGSSYTTWYDDQPGYINPSDLYQ